MPAEYTPQVLEELHLLVSSSLDCWGLSSATSINLLTVSENATFALTDLTDGREIILRVHRIGYSSPQEIRSELAWINALRAAAIVETATPLPGADGELVQRLPPNSDGYRRAAVAFERLPGNEPSSREAPGWFERLGEMTARLHDHARSWRLPPDFRRKRWDVDAMVGAQGHWGPWRAAIGLDAPGAAVLETAIGFIRRRLDRFGTGSRRFGLVHADLRLANLLVDGEHLRIIDFDDCGFSWFLYDFAAAVSFIEHEAVVPDLLEAWLSGYCRITVLPAEDRAEIPSLVVLRRVLLSAWLASHAEIPFAREFGVNHTQGTVRLAEDLLRGKFLALG